MQPPFDDGVAKLLVFEGQLPNEHGKCAIRGLFRAGPSEPCALSLGMRCDL